ncbi:hypothetical protein vseg_016904 [Gypsophila vaccaria]
MDKGNSGGGGRRAWASTSGVSGSGKRIQKEMKELDSLPAPLSSAGPIADNLYHWLATFLASSGTPYEGGLFFLEILFLTDYPFKPPKVVFKTRIFHCNVDSSGNVALHFLKDGWSPALTISKVLLSLTSLFLNPDPYNALVPATAHLYLVDKRRHDELAAEWTLRFAK